MKMMLGICFLGIFIGSFSLCLVLAILNGFQTATHKTLKSINPELELHAHGQELNARNIIQTLKKEFKDVIAASEYDTQQALVFTPYEDSPTTLVMIKGVNARTEHTVNPITDKMITPRNIPIIHLLSLNHVLIGNGLAKELEVQVGDSIEVYFTPSDTRSKKITLSQKKLTISGIFSTGIDEFDNNLAICSLKTLSTMFAYAAPTHISLHIKDDTNIDQLKKDIQKRFSLEAVAWQDRYPAIVAALKLEKYAMFFILALITLVASMNIIALLSMHISSKRTDIAILRAMGIPLRMLKQTFILFGLIITITASILGIICASMTSWFIEQYPCITLPDAYYVTTLPAQMEPSIALLVFFVVMIVTGLALAIAITMIKTINITQVLRFEA